MNYWKWIWDFWKPYRHLLWLLSFLTLLSSLVLLSYPYLLGLVIDTGYSLAGDAKTVDRNYPEFVRNLILALNNWIGVAEPENVDTTTNKIITLVLIVGLLRSFSRIFPRVRMLINNLLGIDIREYYFARIIEKGFKFFTKFRTGDLVTRLTDDIDGQPKIAWFSCAGIFRAIESASQLLLCVVFMFILNWKLATISLLTLPLLLTIYYKLRYRLSDISLSRQKLISQTNDALEAAYSGIRILKAFNVETGQAKSFRQTLSERIETEYSYQSLDYKLKFLYQAINQFGQVIIFAVGGYMVLKDEITVGVFYAFWVYLDLLLPPLTDIPYLFVASRTAFASIDREVELENTPGGTEEIYSGTAEAGKLETVEFVNAGFEYTEYVPDVLKDVSLRIKHGEKAAVVGSVGSGKTTLIKLAAGLYPMSTGSLLYNGNTLNEYNISSYRARVGYIPQEATLFSESVRDNVKFGRKISDDDVLNALELAQIRKEVEEMSDGLDQVLGQKGLTLSGGQKQRVAIARALAGRPDLLLMDDCTSALDAENERRFWDMFSEQYPDTACLIVTHRMSTARQADIIYVLGNGTVVGSGTHDELLESCDEYRNFLSRDELRQALNNKKSR